MATAVPAGVAFHGVLAQRKLIRRQTNHPRDENGDRDAAPCWQHRLSPSPRSLLLVCTVPPLGYRADDSLLQTAIRPNECYHSMMRPSKLPHSPLYDRSHRSARDGGYRRVVRLLQWTRGSCRMVCRVPQRESLGAVYTYVPYRAKDITRNGLSASRIDAETTELFLEHFCG